jgi:hypothetical protein
MLPLALFVVFALMIIAGERLSHKHNGVPTGNRKTRELDCKIYTLNESENGQTPTSLRREFECVLHL